MSGKKYRFVMVFQRVYSHYKETPLSLSLRSSNPDSLITIPSNGPSQSSINIADFPTCMRASHLTCPYPTYPNNHTERLSIAS